MTAVTSAAPPSQSVAAQGFQWKWALLTIPIVAGVTLALMVVAGVCTVIAGVEMESEATSTAVGMAVLIASMLLGGILAGWLSPSRTIVEPGVGIAAALTGFNVALGNTGGILFGWVLPYLIGAAGAWIGEQLPKRFTAPLR
jgi:hypothetical protein